MNLKLFLFQSLLETRELSDNDKRRFFSRSGKLNFNSKNLLPEPGCLNGINLTTFPLLDTSVMIYTFYCRRPHPLNRDLITLAD